ADAVLRGRLHAAPGGHVHQSHRRAAGADADTGGAEGPGREGWSPHPSRGEGSDGRVREARLRHARGALPRGSLGRGAVDMDGEPTGGGHLTVWSLPYGRRDPGGRACRRSLTPVSSGGSSTTTDNGSPRGGVGRASGAVLARTRVGDTA